MVWIGVGRYLGYVTLLAALTCTHPYALRAQEVTVADYQKLRINEILAQNTTTFPQNCQCRHVDMVELYNGSDKTLPLQGPLGSVRITDRSQLPLCADPASDPDCLFITNYLSFRGNFVQHVLPGQRLVIFCDGPILCENTNGVLDCQRPIDGGRETHANFRLDGRGECLLLELKPDSGASIVLHEVVFPALRDDISYARSPEDVDNVDGFVFASPSLGDCFTDAQGGEGGPFCVGEANGPVEKLRPGIERVDFSTNNPAADEAVVFRVRVNDDVDPTPENLASVELRYRVDGGPEQSAVMTYLELVDESGILPEPVNGLPTCPSIDRWSLWEVTLPGQPAGSVVHFSFHVSDADGLEGADPGLPFCDFPVGPCDLNDATGPGLDCPDNVDCSAPFRYTVESSYDGPLVLNEIVPANDSILEDLTDPSCPIENIDCAFDDYVELCNNSEDEIVELAGLILTDRPFRPERGWVFRLESRSLAPGERILVWADNDDEDRVRPEDPPNPNDAASGEHHTDFGINAIRDELYILDSRDAEFRVIDGVRWGRSGRYVGAIVEPLPVDALDGTNGTMGRDLSLSRVRDCDRSSSFRIAAPTPLEPNGDDEEVFRRGDANGSGLADISDPLFILEFMFLGRNPTCQDSLDADDSGVLDINDPLRLLGHLFFGDPLAAPGSAVCGPDLTMDALPPCVYDKCEV